MGRKPSKLTLRDVILIHLFHKENVSMNILARVFRVSQGHIWDIIKGNRRREG